VLIEPKLCAWISAGLALYRANPLMLETVFYDGAVSGTPTLMGPGTLTDSEKLWIPDEYTGGMVRWGDQAFSILSNTADTLTVVGDPSMAAPQEPYAYQIVPPAVAGLTELLNTEKFSVLTSFSQVPAQMPAFTVRLERDTQTDTYLGENLERYAVDGLEFDVRSQALQGSYLISIWATNREAVLWLYAWLQNYALQSMSQFTTWGLYDIAFSGSDLDPALQYLAERTYTRHLLFTATRLERAVTTRNVEWVSDVCVRVCAAYAQLAATVPEPMT
jgi:hypothetical protein